MDQRAFSRRGYTLIEMIVVMAIMGFLAVIAFFGIRDFNQSQAVSDAQRDFIANLRSVKTKVESGADQQNAKIVTFSPGGSYVTDGTTVNLKFDVLITAPTGATTLCFINPHVQSYTCGSCANSFACVGTSPSNLVEVTFTKGNMSKTVKIEGSGLFISRIYAENE